MFIGLCDMRDNLVSFKILDRIIFTRECTIEIVDNIVNTVLVSLSIPITKCIDALNVSTRAILEKLHEPSNATLLIPSENIPHLECAIPLPTLGVIIFISIRSFLISQDKHSKNVYHA